MKSQRAVLRENNPEGFSLLEVLIALLVATVGLISLSTMQVGAIKGNSASNERTRAVYLTQRVLEQINDGNLSGGRVFDYLDTASVPQGTLLASGTMNGVNGKGEAGGPYLVVWQVASHTAWARRITVTVTWRSIIGRTRHVTLSSTLRGEDNR